MEENIKRSGLDFSQTVQNNNNLGKSNEFSHKDMMANTVGMKPNLMYNSRGDVGIDM